MRHLTPDELLDIVEQIPAASAHHAHLEVCPTCREQVERATEILYSARAVDVPEPSPLFWERFSARVHEAIAEEPMAPRRVPHWLRWPVLVPLAGLALLLIALAAAVAPHGDVQEAAAPQIAMDVDLSSDETDSTSAADAAWLVMSDLVGSLDVDEAQEAGIPTAPGTADEAVLQLTAAEQQELLRLLRRELEQPGG